MTAIPLLPANLKAECLAQRREKVRAELRVAGFDGLIAYGNGRHSFLASNPAWYVTGLRQVGPHMAALIPAEGEPAIIVTPAWDEVRAGKKVGLPDVTAVEPDDFLTAVQAVAERLGFSGGRVAVAGGTQPRFVSEAWPQMLRQVEPGDRLVSDISRIRDQWSLACVKRGAAIAEQGFDFILQIAQAGMPEYRLAAEAEAYMRGLGAEDNFQLLSASQHNRAAHRPSDRLLAAGDVLLGEITPSVDGEYVQICRTAVLGGPTEQQQKAFDLLDGALQQAMAAAIPGVAARDIVTIMNEPIVAAGYETYTKPPYMRTRGHSMALGSMDPEIAIDSDEVLLEGMVFVLHPNQYLPETGYIMCGEPVIIAGDGAKPLTSRMGRLETIAA
jgi:Xaa-Pro aminopeptidase